MKARWYISTFIITLTLLATVFQQQIAKPNQEIILQFTDGEVSSEEAQNTIAIVKKQLQTIGVDHIKIWQEEKGRLKITYYSHADVASIKETLSKEIKLELDYTSNPQGNEQSDFPPEENSVSYNLDVYEIKSANETEWDLDGIYVLELKPEADRFFSPNVFASIGGIDLSEDITKIAYRIQRNIALAIDNTSHKIPEVRAGPTI